jgi:hypothetical protein
MKPGAIATAIAAVLIALVAVVLAILNGGGTQATASNYEQCVSSGGTVSTNQIPATCAIGGQEFTTSNPGY